MVGNVLGEEMVANVAEEQGFNTLTIQPRNVKRRIQVILDTVVPSILEISDRNPGYSIRAFYQSLPRRWLKSVRLAYGLWKAEPEEYYQKFLARLQDSVRQAEVTGPEYDNKFLEAVEQAIEKEIKRMLYEPVLDIEIEHNKVIRDIDGLNAYFRDAFRKLREIKDYHERQFFSGSGQYWDTPAIMDMMKMFLGEDGQESQEGQEDEKKEGDDPPFCTR
jgi:hypothetical protein